MAGVYKRKTDKLRGKAGKWTGWVDGRVDRPERGQRRVSEVIAKVEGTLRA